MKTLIRTALLLATWQASTAFAGFSPWNVLARNTLQATVDTTQIECHDGNKPNGHNFPTWASILLKDTDLKQKTADGFEFTGWFGSNVHSYYLAIPNVYECNDLPAALKPGLVQSITAKQVIGEIYQTHADGTCEKTLDETVEVSVGQYKFLGEKQMTVFPIDARNCSTVKP